MSAEPEPLGVYIHWPYCARICPYCDFNVVRDRGRSAAGEALVEAIACDLVGQAALMQAGGGARMELASIYFGGGTPSLMRPEHVSHLIAQAKALWPSSPALEVTLEANPTNADAGRFAALHDAGVERLSLGVQSFDDEALDFLKREHSGAEAGRALDQALAAFPRVSLDLIYGLPGQTPARWAVELAAAAGRGADHLSAYQLTLEPGTPMARAAERRLFIPVDEDLGADFHDVTLDILTGLGFDAYEVSNFARGDAARSRHNLIYWRGQAYVGAGPGAHGRLLLGGVRTATEAERKVAAYVERVAHDGVGWSLRKQLTVVDTLEERILMGLRISEGVALADVERLGRREAATSLVEGGWLSRKSGRLQATAQGRRVLDSVAATLLA